MLRFILTLLAVLAGLNNPVNADVTSLGNVTILFPSGWSTKKESDQRITSIAPDGRQRATVSLMRFQNSPSFQDFERICTLRYGAEKNGISNLSLVPADPAPKKEGGKFTMKFSGAEATNYRIFTGLLSLKENELITIYLEGIGIDSATNADTFKTIAASLKQ